ncbi:hypothetical protein BT69DRAFT_1279002 [Atractiella rhizophila]|nr:hypothetical protein BT69DRAFT_1279002 [Atractiella rhizophila]
MAISNSNNDAKYYGRKDICLLCEHTVHSLFPLPAKVAKQIARATSSSVIGDSPPTIGEWLAYFFYRTALPQTTVFHALHLLNRLSAVYSFSSAEMDAPLARLVHHRLIFTALLLATKYSMDDSYSNRSFAIASKSLFTLREVNEMEMEMMSSLDWTLGSPDLKEIVESYIAEWEEKLMRDRKADSLHRQAAKLASLPSRSHHSNPNPNSHSNHPSSFKRKRSGSILQASTRPIESLERRGLWVTS